LWALNTDIIRDTLINTSTYPIYSLYKVDKSNGIKIDSIEIIGSLANLQSGDLWGLEFYNDKFYVSYKGGWGPCLIEIDKENSTNELCCTHLVGITIANDSIWAIRSGGNTITTTNGTYEYWKYRIDCVATDIAYDGVNFWVVDTLDNKIKKLETISITSIKALSVSNIVQVYPNPATEYISIIIEGNSNINSFMIFDVNGRIIENNSQDEADYQKINISHLSKGEYFISLKFPNKRVTKPFVKN
jgi:hypothetical protein